MSIPLSFVGYDVMFKGTFSCA